MENDEEQPCPGFYVPVDKEGANIIVTINSKEPFGEPDDMKFWWKIFYAAKEDWTVSSTNWEGSTGACSPATTRPGRSRWAESSRTPDELRPKPFCTPNEGMPTMQPGSGSKIGSPKSSTNSR